MKLYSRMMLIGCTCIATLALSAGVTYAQTTGACCLPNGDCETITQLSCDTAPKIGTFQGEGSVCGPGGVCGACCLTNDVCETITQLSCDTAPKIGAFQGKGTACEPDQGCCLPSPYGTCMDMAPVCCLAVGGVPCGPGNLCQGDNNNNGLDDACEDPFHPIPALSSYGLVALLLLTAVAGVIVIRRSRRGDATA